MRVAIAEDDFRVANIHEQFLKRVPDIELVGKATNALETITLLAEQDVDVLLLDVYMPDQLGTDILDVIRRKYPNINIIIITAATEKKTLEKCSDYGVIDYIIKPITFERFEEAIIKSKKRQLLMQARDTIDQEVIDQFFGSIRLKESPEQRPPKGIDPITLEKVKQILAETPLGITAEAMGEKMGASRTTSRRYLEYLISGGAAEAELEYGLVGRPERKYRLS